MRRSWPPREELYRLVWSRPAEDVAQELGVSGTALAKRCAAADVPKPPRGYWQRHAAGKRDRQPPLPKSVRAVPKKVARPAPFVPPETPEHLPGHRVVRQTAAAYRRAEMDVFGRLVLPPFTPGPVLALMVSRAALHRALHLVGRRIALTRAAHMTLLVDASGTRLCVARPGAGAEQLHFRIKEEVRARPDLPLLPVRSSFKEPRRQKAEGTGRLSVIFLGTEGLGLRSVWKDGAEPLERQLGALVEELGTLPRRRAELRQRQAEAVRVAAERHAEVERLAAIQWKAQEDLRQRRERALACRSELLRQAEQWHACRRLETYLQAAGQALDGGAAGDAEKIAVWKAWAAAELEQRQPLLNGSLQQLVGEVAALEVLDRPGGGEVS